MNSESLHIQSVRIDRACGIERGEGFPLDALSPGFNLIHGPNGVGKTTAGLCLQAMLWPTGAKRWIVRPTASGRLVLGNEPWEVSLEGGHPTCRHNGVETASDAMQVGPVESRRRYWLALIDLLASDDKDFARRIAEATLGGVDLDAAAEKLGFDPSPTVARGPSQRIKDAEQAIRDGRREETELETETARLPDLKTKLGEAREASREVATLNDAKQYAEASLAITAAEQAIEAMPAAVAQLREDDVDRIDGIISELTDAQVSAKQAASKRDDAKKALAEADLPEQGVPPQTLNRLRGDFQSLATLESDLERTESEQAKAGKKLELAANRLGAAFTDEQLHHIDRLELPELTDLARRFARHRAFAEGREAKLKSLQYAPDATVDQSAESLQRGIEHLAGWLAQPVPATSPQVATPVDGKTANTWRRWLAVGLLAAVLAAVTIAMTVVLSPWWLWLLLLAAGLPVLHFVLTRSAASPPVETLATDPRAHYQREYERTDLSLPGDWTTEAVGETLRELVRLLIERRLADRLTQARRQAETSEPPEEISRVRLDEDLENLARRQGLQITPDTEEWLVTFAGNLDRWQDARDALAAAEAVVAKMTENLQEISARIRHTLAEYGVETHEADHAETITRHIENLAEREHRRANAQRERQAAEGREDQAETDQVKALNRLASLAQRLELDPDAKPDTVKQRIADLSKHRPDYEKQQKQLAEQRGVRNTTAQRLADRADLLDLEPADIDGRIHRAQASSEDVEKLNQEIAGIEQQLKQAHLKHDVADALQRRDEALADLAEQRDQIATSVAGAAMIDWLRDTARQQSRPEVFRQANGMLTRITSGSLSLETLDSQNGSSEPGFAARDNTTDRVRPLQELSTGERVQVLLAVRLGFIATDERVRLPLILDEVLATMDDQRAGAVIDAVIEALREGRQVFCLTAQHDEAGKWLSRVQAAGIEHRVIDLAATRGRSDAEARPLDVEPVQRPAVPAPTSEDRHAYADLLDIPAINPYSSSAAEVHLWHLFDNPHVLHRVLHAGYTRWGPLHAVLEQGVSLANLVGESDPPLQLNAEQLTRRAEAIEAVCEAWRQGRGQPVTREAIEECPAVGESFIDRVHELSEQLGHDARSLVDQVKYLTRWRTKKTTELESWLTDHGYLDPADRLTRDQLRARGLAVLARTEPPSPRDRAWLDNLIAGLSPQDD